MNYDFERLGYRLDSKGWRCPFCKKFCESTNAAEEHYQFNHSGRRLKRYRVPAGTQMWLYIRKGKTSQGQTEFTASGPEVSSKEVTYTDIDVCKDPDGRHPLGMFKLFLLPANTRGHEYVAFRVQDVEELEDAIQS